MITTRNQNQLTHCDKRIITVPVIILLTHQQHSHKTKQNKSKQNKTERTGPTKHPAGGPSISVNTKCISKWNIILWQIIIYFVYYFINYFVWNYQFMRGRLKVTRSHSSLLWKGYRTPATTGCHQHQQQCHYQQHIPHMTVCPPHRHKSGHTTVYRSMETAWHPDPGAIRGVANSSSHTTPSS